MEEDPGIAVALRYARDGADPPRVAAEGHGAVAARIVEVARANGVAVQSDQELARLLATLELESPIPLAAFAAVAEILARLYRANQRLREGE